MNKVENFTSIEYYLKDGYKYHGTTKDGLQFWAKKTEIYGEKVVQYQSFNKDGIAVNLVPNYIAVDTLKFLKDFV